MLGRAHTALYKTSSKVRKKIYIASNGSCVDYDIIIFKMRKHRKVR